MGETRSPIVPRAQHGACILDIYIYTRIKRALRARRGLQNYMMGLYYGTITELYYWIILRDNITELYYGIILQENITDLCYRIILRDNITEL